MKYTKFLGLDVHKDTVAVAVAKEGREVAESLGTINNSPEAIAKLVCKLGLADHDMGTADCVRTNSQETSHLHTTFLK